ncbi:PTS sugar transporter subunit IIC [Collinsella vaginalis]|uniref:PTS sugar transporter subunit IIC n=1 Tax=Collinsella vaginalis TaxID=1870987 RepID=UPI000A26C433|nr:PTS transporter subunit EIIC [Collinsella vaginalis]
MAHFDGLFESKAMQKIQEYGGKLQTNKAFSSISSGMMGTMNLILAGAVFTIIATILNIAGVLETTDPVYQWLQLPYKMTMGVMAIAVAFGVAYTYTKNLEMKGEVANGFVALFLFLMVASPVKSVTLADGSTMNALDSSFLGGTGMFTALIMPLIVVRIIKTCQDRNITIKMPDSVPPFLSDSFATLIPLVINIVLWCGINTLVQNTMGTTLPGAVIGVLSIPLSVLISGPGIIVIVFIAMLLWCLGIHGSAVAFAVLIAPHMAAYQANAELVAAGSAPVFSAVFLFSGLACCGGTGNVLPLAVHCMRAKSEQLSAIGKAGVIPAIFNISEPLVFGVPIMYNPLICIPFILNAVITTALLWLGFSVGFFQPPYVMILTALPVFLGEFLGSLAWQNLFIPVVGFVVGYLCYAPFVKMYDKQCLENEAAQAAEMNAE